ncbi:MAG: hypothetical protein LBP22_11905 [Deltaproteobacteria bacterium]|jgi:hypothetical protein|nr:hypothetical protein [Deltaproteobacteria bacterium]
MVEELVAFLNFNFELNQVSTKLVDGDHVSSVNRWRINWREYTDHLKNLGIATEEKNRSGLDRYATLQSGTELYNDLVNFQCSLKDSLTEITENKKVSRDFLQRIFRRTNGLPVYIDPISLNTDLCPDNIGDLRFAQTYETPTYGLFISAILRDLILKKQIFHLTRAGGGNFILRLKDDGFSFGLSGSYTSVSELKPGAAFEISQSLETELDLSWADMETDTGFKETSEPEPEPRLTAQTQKPPMSLSSESPDPLTSKDPDKLSDTKEIKAPIDTTEDENIEACPDSFGRTLAGQASDGSVSQEPNSAKTGAEAEASGEAASEVRPETLNLPPEDRAENSDQNLNESSGIRTAERIGDRSANLCGLDNKVQSSASRPKILIDPLAEEGPAPELPELPAKTSFWGRLIPKVKAGVKSILAIGRKPAEPPEEPDRLSPSILAQAISGVNSGWSGHQKENSSQFPEENLIILTEDLIILEPTEDCSTDPDSSFLSQAPKMAQTEAEESQVPHVGSGLAESDDLNSASLISDGLDIEPSLKAQETENPVTEAQSADEKSVDLDGTLPVTGRFSELGAYLAVTLDRPEDEAQIEADLEAAENTEADSEGNFVLAAAKSELLQAGSDEIAPTDELEPTDPEVSFAQAASLEDDSVTQKSESSSPFQQAALDYEPGSGSESPDSLMKMAIAAVDSLTAEARTTPEAQETDYAQALEVIPPADSIVASPIITEDSKSFLPDAEKSGFKDDYEAPQSPPAATGAVLAESPEAYANSFPPADSLKNLAVSAQAEISNTDFSFSASASSVSQPQFSSENTASSSAADETAEKPGPEDSTYPAPETAFEAVCEASGAETSQTQALETSQVIMVSREVSTYEISAETYPAADGQTETGSEAEAALIAQAIAREFIQEETAYQAEREDYPDTVETIASSADEFSLVLELDQFLDKPNQAKEAEPSLFDNLDTEVDSQAVVLAWEELVKKQNWTLPDQEAARSQDMNTALESQDVQATYNSPPVFELKPEDIITFTLSNAEIIDPDFAHSAAAASSGEPSGTPAELPLSSESSVELKTLSFAIPQKVEDELNVALSDLIDDLSAEEIQPESGHQVLTARPLTPAPEEEPLLLVEQFLEPASPNPGAGLAVTDGLPVLPDVYGQPDTLSQSPQDISDEYEEEDLNGLLYLPEGFLPTEVFLATMEQRWSLKSPLMTKSAFR